MKNILCHGTTILSLHRDNKTIMIGDGQITLGSHIFKSTAKKVRRIGKNQDILAGFAGATADALTLIERLEEKLEERGHLLERSCVELAKDWRTDKYLRRLEAMMLVADNENSFVISGTGDVIRPEYRVMGIGSGGTIALAIARSLLLNTKMGVEEIANISMNITSDLCIYTNKNFTVEIL